MVIHSPEYAGLTRDMYSWILMCSLQMLWEKQYKKSEMLAETLQLLGLYFLFLQLKCQA